jgi:hypothetical protein
MQKEAEDTRNLRGELSTAKANNKTLQKHKAKLNA